MKYKKRVKFLKGLLNIIGSFMLFLIILSLSFSIMNMENKGIKNTVLSIIFSLIFFGGYTMIIINFRKILDSILQNEPFNLDNIIYFKKIGYYILAVGIVDAIVNYPKSNNTGFDIISTSTGSLKPSFFLYIVLSILAFILSDVFKMAMEIKDENDLTI